LNQKESNLVFPPLPGQAGGQAIVGAVNTGTTPGGGASNENQRQPHAIVHSPGKTLPREIEAHREAVPLASG
jgi:hypothetical protein